MVGSLVDYWVPSSMATRITFDFLMLIELGFLCTIAPGVRLFGLRRMWYSSTAAAPDGIIERARAWQY